MPIRKNDDVRTIGDCLGDLFADSLQRSPQAIAARECREQGAHGVSLEARISLFDVKDPIKADVIDDRVRQLKKVATLGAGVEQVALGADHTTRRGHKLFTNPVKWRVRDLREQLLEVVVQQPGSVRENSNGRIGTH